MLDLVGAYVDEYYIVRISARYPDVMFAQSLTGLQNTQPAVFQAPYGSASVL